MGLRDTGPVSRAALVMMSAKTDQSVMIVMIGSQGICHKLITPTVNREGKGCYLFFSRCSVNLLTMENIYLISNFIINEKKQIDLHLQYLQMNFSININQPQQFGFFYEISMPR